MKSAILTATLFLIALAGCNARQRPGGRVGSPPRKTGPEHAVGWVRVTSADGRFTARFPVDPVHKVLEEGRGHSYLAEFNHGNGAFVASCRPLACNAASVDLRFAEVRKVMKANPDARVTPVTVSGLPAQEMICEYNRDGVRYELRHRIVDSHGMMYQLVVTTTKGVSRVSDEDVRRFFDGFELLPAPGKGVEGEVPDRPDEPGE